MALATLHYLAGPVIVLSFGISRTVAACFLHQKSRNISSSTRRIWAIRLILAAILTLIGQGTTYCFQSLSHPGFNISQDNVIFIVAGVLVYGWLLISLHDNRDPVWYTYTISWTLAAVFEATISVLRMLSISSPNRFTSARLTFQVSRSLLLVVLSLSQCWYAYSGRLRSFKEDDETAPLLKSDTNGHAVPPSYDAAAQSDDELDDGFDSDEEDPEEWKEMKQRQKARLQESGSWLNYMKEFKIFIPMLWPSRNKFIQLCLVVIGLVLMATRILNVLVPRQLGIVIDELTAGKNPWRSVGLWMFLSYLNSEAGIRLIQNLAELPVQQFAYKRLGVESFAHIMDLSMDFHNNKNSGELIRAIDQGQNLQHVLEFCFIRVPPMFLDLIIAFVYTWTLFDIYLSLILAVVGFLYVWVGVNTTVWSVKRRRSYNTALRYEGKVQQEGINNWQTVSHFNRGKHECERYERSIEEFNKAERSYLFSFYFGGSAQSLVMILGRLAAIGLAVYRVSQGAAPVGHLVTLTVYWECIEYPLMEMSWSIRRLTHILTDAERLLQLFQTKQTVCDAPGARDLRISNGRVEFEHVEFAYDPRRPTLKDLSFTAQPGQTIALVGETGGGKSTILKLLYRYYDIASGSIRIDGQDIRGVTLDSLREAFGMVPQDPALFNITIMENLRYARLNATDEEVKEACRDAAIHDKIESFPDKYESTVGERGVKLSGGELQRVAIARAILRQPKIVLLDEATSMIDAETEATIQQAFKRLSASRTTFVIAHRLSTIQHADQILVIHDGRIVERGTHDELFRQNGRYVALWSKQLTKDVQDIGDVLRGNEKKADSSDSGEESSSTDDGTDGGFSMRQRRR